MKLFAAILFSTISTSILGQTILEGIPDSLQKNANEIVLSDETTYTITDIRNSFKTRHYKAVIMNEQASGRNKIHLPYDDFQSIEDAQVRIFNRTGEELKKYKLKDFSDYSTKSFSIASDNRAKYLSIKAKNYPYLIEVEYSIKYVGSMFYPIWTPQSDEKQSVLHASLKIDSYQPIRFKAVNNASMELQERDGSFSYHSSLDSIKAFVQEPFSRFEDHAPIIYTGPNEFEMDGYVGNMSTWEDFGKWHFKVNSGRNTLTREMVTEVLDQIPEDASVTEKTKLIYQYLQHNTRYVSIQLGIGGWQPFESGFVHEKKYGDCKALSFYTQSLLSLVGVESFYTTIYAGSSHLKIDPSFPLKLSNHIILTVPTEKDTIWLECTDQTKPFGYLGTFTSDRHALMITPEGGKLIRTKAYTADENKQATAVKMFINENGSAELRLKRTYQGIEVENKHFDYYALKSTSEQEKWFVDDHNWGSLKLKELKISPPSYEKIPSGSMEVEVELHRAALASGKRLFYQPFIFTNMEYLSLPDHERTVPLEIKYPYIQKDSIEVIFPDLYLPERALKDVKLETKYGTYTRKIQKQEDSYLFIREFRFEKGLYPPAEYSSFRDFIKTVQKYDRQKLVMINKT